MWWLKIAHRFTHRAGSAMVQTQIEEPEIQIQALLGETLYGARRKLAIDVSSFGMSPSLVSELLAQKRESFIPEAKEISKDWGQKHTEALKRMFKGSGRTKGQAFLEDYIKPTAEVLNKAESYYGRSKNAILWGVGSYVSAGGPMGGVRSLGMGAAGGYYGWKEAEAIEQVEDMAGQAVLGEGWTYLDWMI